MPSTVEELTPTRVKLTIEIPAADLKPHLDKAYREIAKQVNIPGFRQGKVPAAIIDQRFGKGAVLQEAINEVLPEAYGKALEEQQVVPMGQPEIEVNELAENGDVSFTAEVDRRPEFSLPDTKGIAVTVDALKPLDDDVNERIEMLRQRFATNAEVDRAAQEGDLVTVDLVGTVDGERLEDATASGVTFKVGDDTMLQGLDAAVTGLKAGESADFTSELVGGAHKGTVADIHVVVNKVQEQELPALDDEFAQLVSQFDTVEEMRQDLASGVERQAAMQQAADARDKALEKIVEATELELPAKALAGEIEGRHADVEHQLNHAGLTLEQYLNDVEEGKSVEDFWQEMDDRTQLAMRAQLILDKVAEERQIDVEEADFTEHLYRRAMQNGTTPTDEANQLMQTNQMGEWVAEIRRNKALNALMADVTATDSNGKAVDFSILNPPLPKPAAEASSADDADEAPAAPSES